MLQGTRQGSKSSPLFYILYINNLITELEQSGLGICVYDFNISSPTVADDMVLVSFSRKGLQLILDICARYASKWRYQYNASKCSSILKYFTNDNYMNEQMF